MQLEGIGRNRLVLGCLLAVAFVAASALVYLQYRSLSQMQDQTRRALVGNLRQALIGARMEAANDFLLWPRRALLGLDIHEFLRHGDIQKMRGVAETTRRISPYVGLFFGSRDVAGGPPEVFVFRPAEMRRMERIKADPAEDSIREVLSRIKETTSHWYYSYAMIGGEKQQVFVHMVDDCPVEPRGPHVGKFGYYGFTVTSRTASRYFAQLLDKHLAPLAAAAALRAPGSGAVGAVFNESGARLTTSKEVDSVQFLAEESLGGQPGILPGWTIRAGFPAGTLNTFDQIDFMKNLGIVLVITSFLLVGFISLALTTVREMKLSRAKSDFVASVSHELKTPLSLIQGFVETLRMGRLNDPSHRDDYLKIIEAETKRLANLIDRILDASKIEAGLKRYSPEPVDVAPLIEEALANFGHEFERGAFVVERQIEPALPPARLDSEAFLQALSNLLSNAVKYSGDERHITVKAARNNGDIEVCVTDHGIGIPKKEHRRIFNRFYRASQNGSKVEGAGLGLAQVRHFATAHGGDVSVASEPGKGSSFAIRLPLST